MIDLLNVWKSYSRKQVLKNVCLKIGRGELFCLVGPNGAGKTTTLRLINMLDKPDRGRILFDGVDTESIDEDTTILLRRRMAFVFQQPVIYNTSVYKNAAIGLEIRRCKSEETVKRVREALETVGLWELKERNASFLSGGEVQRLCLARALAMRPEVLLLDEPTTNLDPATTLIVEGVIKEYNGQGCTVVFTTHDMLGAKRLGRRIALIIEGEIVEAGSVEEFFENPLDERTRRFVRGEFTVR